MHEKLEQLLNKIKAERAEFQERLPHSSEDFHALWADTEQRWEKLQLQLRESGLSLVGKAGGLLGLGAGLAKALAVKIGVRLQFKQK